MEQLKAFLEKAGADSELTIKLEELGDGIEKSDEFIAIAAVHGFTVTVKDIEEIKSEAEKKEISEEQLEAVAGGTGWTVDRYCKEWCKNLTTSRIACQHPILPCDHFRSVLDGRDSKYDYFMHSCTKRAFPKYLYKQSNEYRWE